jgi:hypothetical protein
MSGLLISCAGVSFRVACRAPDRGGEFGKPPLDIFSRLFAILSLKPGIDKGAFRLLMIPASGVRLRFSRSWIVSAGVTAASLREMSLRSGHRPSASFSETAPIACKLELSGRNDRNKAGKSSSVCGMLATPLQ